MPILTLTTDFGTGDYYVGAMKGVALGIAPDARLIDISHQIPPQDVLAAAFVLRHAAREFPPGTVHLAVVDPGVGTARRPIAVAAADQLWIGPDNGLFSFVLNDARVHHIANKAFYSSRPSRTFHGRDIFAPIAAHLCTGLDLAAVGPPVYDPVLLPEITAQKSAQRIAGRIIHIDHFGNLVTNIAAADIEPWGTAVNIRLGSHALAGLSRTYGDVAEDAPLALIGSVDLLEISVNGGSAAQRFGLDRRDPIIVEPTTER